MKGVSCSMGWLNTRLKGTWLRRSGTLSRPLNAFRLAAGVDGGVILLSYHYTCKVLCISLVDNPFHLIGGYGRAADRLLAHKTISSVGCDISVYQVLYRIQIVDERIRTACGDEYPDALGLGNLKGLYGGAGDGMRLEANQSAVDVEEECSDHISLLRYMCVSLSVAGAVLRGLPAMRREPADCLCHFRPAKLLNKRQSAGLLTIIMCRCHRNVKLRWIPACMRLRGSRRQPAFILPARWQVWIKSVIFAIKLECNGKERYRFSCGGR